MCVCMCVCVCDMSPRHIIWSGEVSCSVSMHGSTTSVLLRNKMLLTRLLIAINVLSSALFVDLSLLHKTNLNL